MSRDVEKQARASRLRWARKHAGYRSARAAAKACNWPAGYRAHESGQNGFFTDVGKKYASKYKVDYVWLMTGAGTIPPGYSENEPGTEVEREEGADTLVGDEDMIPVIGVVRSGGMVDYSMSGELGSVPPPPDGNEWKALRVEGDAIRPTYQDGDILYYSSTRFAPEQVVNRECVVSVSGAIYVRIVRGGAEPGRWHLSAVTSEPLMNQPIEWATPIQWVRKRELTAA